MKDTTPVLLISTCTQHGIGHVILMCAAKLLSPMLRRPAACIPFHVAQQNSCEAVQALPVTNHRDLVLQQQPAPTCNLACEG